MYKVCVVDDNPLIRNVLRSVLAHNDFDVAEFCEIGDRCPSFTPSCGGECPKSAPCRNMLIVAYCEREPRGMQFLQFITRAQCPCVHSFKVLYTCEEPQPEEIEKLNNVHVQFIEKHDAAIDMLPIIEKYKEWYRQETLSSGGTA
jgi:hypothetical protein